MSASMKAVAVIAPDLPVGVALNPAALLGISLGHEVADLVGVSGSDASGGSHLGMSTLAVPVLTGPREEIRGLHARAADHQDLVIADMNKVAQDSRTYEAYLKTLSGTKSEDLNYLGVMIYGPRQAVESLTGRLPLYR